MLLMLIRRLGVSSSLLLVFSKLLPQLFLGIGSLLQHFILNLIPSLPVFSGDLCSFLTSYLCLLVTCRLIGFHARLILFELLLLASELRFALLLKLLLPLGL